MPNPQQTMTSLELVKIINDLREEGQAELRHTDFTAKIRKVLGDEGAKFSAPLKTASGQTAQGYILPKRECHLMVMSESYKVQAAVYDRMVELESSGRQVFKIPQTLSEALLLAGQLAAEKEAALAQIEADKPKVEFAETVRNMQGSCAVGDFAKTIGYGRNKLFKMMRDDLILMKNNLPYQRYIDMGCFVVIEQIPYTDSNGKTHPAFTTMVTGKGQVFLEKKYRKPPRNGLVLLQGGASA